MRCQCSVEALAPPFTLLTQWKVPTCDFGNGGFGLRRSFKSPTKDAILSSLLEYLKPRDRVPQFVENWKQEIEKLAVEFNAAAAANGFTHRTRDPIYMSDAEIWEFFGSMATDGSMGYFGQKTRCLLNPGAPIKVGNISQRKWYRLVNRWGTYNQQQQQQQQATSTPNHLASDPFGHRARAMLRETTKETLRLSVSGELLALKKEFIDSVRQLSKLCGSPDGSKHIVVSAMGKYEPVPNKKLVNGRHRSIHSPGPVANVFELLQSHFVKDGRVYKHDDVCKVEAVRLAMGNHFVIGLAPKQVHAVLREAYADGASSYDISGWDRSLPMGVIETFFRAFVSEKGAVLGTGYCGKGIVHVDDNLYRFPDGTAAWASGGLKTLFGNTMIHIALLRSLNLKHFHVQGDDCIFNRCIDGISLIADIAKVGLEARDFKSDDSVEFCKIRPASTVLEFEVADIYDKISLLPEEKRNDGITVAMAMFCSWEVRQGTFHLPTDWLMPSRIGGILRAFTHFQDWFDIEIEHPFSQIECAT